MRDFKVDEKGDLIIDPDTHDIEMVDGVEEVMQRVKATLEIRFGEMVNLAPEYGSDYTSFFGRKVNTNNVASDITASVTSQVPEVESLKDFKFEYKPKRKMEISFTATVKLSNGESSQKVKEVMSIGQQ